MAGWLRLGSSGSNLEPAGIGSAGQGESFWQLTETTPATTPTTKTWSHKPNTLTQYQFS